MKENQLLSALLLTVCLWYVTGTLLETRQCTYGPSYWCHSLKNAKDCNAVKHCIQTVWESKQLPEDNSDICNICKEIVKGARDTLHNNETQEELKKLFKGSCNLIPCKIVLDECIHLADDFIPELIETLTSQMNPQMICATAELCNSPRVDKMLLTCKTAENQNTNEDPQSLATVDDCKKFVADTIRLIKTLSKTELMNHLMAICGQLSSLSGGCMVLVETNFDGIYNFLTRELSSDAFCHLRFFEEERIQHVNTIDTFKKIMPRDSVPMIKGNSSNLKYEVCAIIGFEEFYCPGDMFCCIPGSPISTCCAVIPCCDGVACCPEEAPKCCITGCCPEATECCGAFCCPELISECCGGLICCPKGISECNALQATCCPKNKPKACSHNVCCSEDGCCGDKCCDSGRSCCNDHSCCDDASSSCCPNGCNACKYPWSALPCTSTTINIESIPSANTCPTPGSFNGSIYRILRKDESCENGLLSQDTSGNSDVTPKQHLACINESSIFTNSPYITFSSDPKSLEKLIVEFSSLNLTLAKVDQSKIPSVCTSIDLTTDDNINKYLQGDQRAMIFAKSWCTYLIECGNVPVPCTVQPIHI